MTDASAVRVHNRITIRAPLERVWQHTVDIGSWSDWSPTITQAYLIKAGWIASGILFYLKQPLQRARIWEGKRLEAPQHVEWATTGWGISFHASHTLRETKTGIVNTLSLEVKGIPWGVRTVCRLLFSLALTMENRALKRQCEVGHVLLNQRTTNATP